MTSRRQFLRRSLSAGMLMVGGGMPWSAFAGDIGVDRSLTILHTNDFHSRVQPFPADHSRYPGMGGAAKRASLIEKIRREEKHVLLFDSGDIFQGTPYFDAFGGELEMKLMSQMGYDAATMGNHDFDAHIIGFDKQLKHCAFPFLVANYDFSDTVLKAKVAKHKVFLKGDLRIGVFGLGIELAGLVPEKLYGSTRYLEPIAIANETANYLRNAEKCDLVVCLSHLGLDYKTDKISDKKLAAKSTNIDLILGGHTHTFLDSPLVVKNLQERPVLINQAGWAGLLLGRIDIGFQRGSKKVARSSLPVIVR